MKKTITIFGLIFIALIIGTFYDLQISQFLFRDSFLGMIYEDYIFYLVAILMLYGFVMLYVVKRKIYILFVGIIGVTVSCYLMNESMFSLPAYLYTILTLIFVLIVAYISYLIIIKQDPHRRTKLANFYLLFILTFLFTTIFLFALKYFGGRIIYRDLNSIEQFNPWYVFGVYPGGHSFPSGHTGLFATIMCFSVHPYFKKKTRLIVNVLVIIGIISMAFMRVVAGAHYLSDTVVGLLITITVFIILKKHFEKRCLL